MQKIIPEVFRKVNFAYTCTKFLGGSPLKGSCPGILQDYPAEKCDSKDKESEDRVPDCPKGKEK